MKYLRKYIRQILLEDAFDFAREAGQLQATAELDPPPEDFGKPLSKGSRRKIKDLFRKHADHQWLANNIATIHWVKDLEVLNDLVGKGKDELSTSMSKAGSPVFWHDYGAYGLWIKGHISLAANSMNDIVSGHFRDYGPHGEQGHRSEAWDADKVSPEKFKQQQASSGINKQPKTIDRFGQYSSLDDNEKNRKIFNKYIDDFPYVLDADTWKEPERFPNEALVDNWKPEGIIIADDDKIEWLEDTATGFYREITGLANKFGVPIFDKNFKALWYPGE